MNENCKYCKTSKTCLENADYGSIYCRLHKRIPKVISKTYEELQEENQKYKEVIDKAIKYIEQHAITVTDGTITTNKHELLEILKEVE